MTTPWSRVARELRSVTAASLTLTLRRARRDAALLAAWGLLVAFVALLAVAAPQQLGDTVDRGARQAVATAGPRADPIIRVQVGESNRTTGRGPAAQPLEPFGVAISLVDLARPPPVVRHVSTGTTTTVIGPITNIATIAGVTTGADFRLQASHVDPGESFGCDGRVGRTARSIRHGRCDSGRDVRSGRAGLGVKLGNVVGVAKNPGFSNAHHGEPIPLRVVAIIAQAPGSAPDWLDSPGLWAPTHPASLTNSLQIGVTVLTTLSGVTVAGSSYADTFTAEFRVRLAPSRFSGGIEPKVAAAINGLQASPARLTGGIGGDAVVSSNFAEALASYPAQSRAAVAQMSLILAGLLGAAVAVMILLVQLVVRRRATDMTLERARGRR